MRCQCRQLTSLSLFLTKLCLQVGSGCSSFIKLSLTMFATNAPQAASELSSLPKESGRTGRVEIARCSSEEGNIDNLKGSGDTPQHKSSPPAEQVSAVNKAYLKQTKKAGGEKLDDALPRLAPVRIPSLGTKWEYYSGAPLPQEPRSPDGDGDSEDSAEGPKLPNDASKSSAPRARSIGSSLSTGSNFSRTSQGGIKRKRSLPGTPGRLACSFLMLTQKAMVVARCIVGAMLVRPAQQSCNEQAYVRAFLFPPRRNTGNDQCVTWDCICACTLVRGTFPPRF